MTQPPSDQVDLFETEPATETIPLQRIVPTLDSVLSWLVIVVLFGSCGLIAWLAYLAGSDWGKVAGMGFGLAALLALMMFAVVRILWTPQARRFPAQPILSDAMARSGHSLAFGALCRFNGCITAVVDSQHLHLVPVAVFRWFGAKRMSLPWTAIRDVRPFLIPSYARAEVAGTAIIAPAWCLELASTAVELTPGSTPPEQVFLPIVKETHR
ncbi:MAG: hypothetical protein EA377_10365 [Phycisphaerales bacterium]|nr:MAG: hypothetical protein EA377_10365 [Phycisphaerales bacterium]